jgi:glycosyltransferase involved in cell wall biosynthesis
MRFAGLGIKKIFSLANNCFFSISKKRKLFYVVENADWSIKWDGKYITTFLNKIPQIGFVSTVVETPLLLKNKLIHFGSANTFFGKRGFLDYNKRNKVVLTWFHVAKDDCKNVFAKELNHKVDIVHTSCQKTKEELIGLGVGKEKIVVIPLGVDLEKFKVIDDGEKRTIKNELGIPEDKIIIGSFQKDGNGWGQGNEPKLIKGPDIFCDVVEKLNRKIPVHILLTGPARGYVKNRLKKSNIGFTHIFLKNYLDIPKYYAVLDLYLITSRAEGGPKAIGESMASGVPIISTKVGMAPDYIIDGQNGMLCEIEDVDCLAEKALKVASDKNLRDKLIRGGLKTAKELDISKIAERYYQEIYKKLL